MAQARGTAPAGTDNKGGKDVSEIAVKEKAVVEKVNEDGLTESEVAELEEKENERKEDKKNAKAALTRLTNAVENARDKGWTVSCRVDRIDVDEASEGHTL